MAPITQFSQLDLSRSYSYADYLSWKFSERVELIKGRVLPPVPGRSLQHQRCSRAILYTAYQYLKSKGSHCHIYHNLDVRLLTAEPNGDQQADTVVQPDICVVCDSAKLDDRGCVGAPDWIIEIVSPGNMAHDIKTKFDLYEENGVLEYWMVFPGLKTVTAYVLENGQYQLVGEYIEPGPMPAATLPGLIVEWADIFDEQ